ncbi:uncharacterized protein LOC113799303 [Dermatophagoides pteronyssinus]|uniref:DNA-directed RNA polymerase I subunit D n=1 Tax=Dermatophagoides pteronyssinus TaxID=6956 RepID=A0A6P6YLQ2_DERPT|nr:DNA-directed RNA polymerases I and III subunit RPAC2-like [Dermatophagoides pteronyssinus]
MDKSFFETSYINDDKTCATFKFFFEDHTLANVLRNQILENPNVEFCGYSIPHPSEEYFQLQIQTRNSLNVYDALLNGFEELSKLCDKTKKLFIEAVDKYKIDNNMS